MLSIVGGPFQIAGLRIGHATRPEGPTGSTVLLFPEGATAACDVRGGAPGTREAAALDPINLVPHVHALLLTGGSAFGLDAAGGVMLLLEELGVGLPTPGGLVPIVPAAVIYDLACGDGRVRPDRDLGYAAAAGASVDGGAEGNVGAGIGATVGKVLGHERAMKGGVGMAAARTASGHTIGALAVVNAFGDVVDPTSGSIIAGARGPDGEGFADTLEVLAAKGVVRPRGERRGAEVASERADGGWSPLRPGSSQNTTLVAVITDIPLGKPGLGRVARMAHGGLARAVRPSHTEWDGDIVYALSTGGGAPLELAGSVVGAIACEVVARAVVRGVTEARTLLGYPGLGDGG